ncbi:hypothetical protein CR513_61862, partial [Mucuna pruriens]
MPGLDPNLASHHLAINPSIRFISPKRRRMSPKKLHEVERQVFDLMDIRNNRYPKDSYPLLNINRLVDGSSRFKLLSYSRYNQILMHPDD